MRVKMFWKNDLGDLQENSQNGAIPSDSQVGLKGHWKDWWFKGAKFQGKSREELSARKAQELEDEITAWLAQNSGARVLEIKQSAVSGSWGPSRWLVSVWYEEVAEVRDIGVEVGRGKPESLARAN